MRRIYIVGILLVLVTFAAYWGVLDNGFLNYDDNTYVTENGNVLRGLTWAGVAWAFTSGYAANWHPLTWLSHMLDVSIYGTRPAGHHLTNLLFHLANVLLLFLVLLRLAGSLSGNPKSSFAGAMTDEPEIGNPVTPSSPRTSSHSFVWRCAFVAALFAIHPLHVESVAWIAERKDVLSVFFFLLTILAYVRYVERPEAKTYVFVVLALALGLMAKPMLVTLPFVLLLLDYWPLNRFNVHQQPAPGSQRSASGTNTQHPTPNTGSSASTSKSRSRSKRILVDKIPLLLLVVVSSVVTYIVQSKEGAVMEEFPFGMRATNAVISYVLYMWKMVWPLNLGVFYPHLTQHIPVWQVAGSLALLVCISAAAILLRQRHRYLLVGWFWYLGTLVPVIGLVQVGGQAMADRYTYVPLIGLFVMIAWGVPDLLRSGRVGEWENGGRDDAETRRRGDAGNVQVRTPETRNRKPVTEEQTPNTRHPTPAPSPHFAVALVVLVILGVLTWRQVGYWRDSITLFRHAVSVTTDNVVAHNNLGVAYTAAKRTDDAIAEYMKVLTINPDNYHAHYNLANMYAARQDYPEAARHYSEAIRLRPDASDARTNYGNALMELGRKDEAIVQYKEALRIDPGNPAKQNLEAALSVGSGGKSEFAFREALRRDPGDVDAGFGLADLLLKQDRYDEAARYYEQGLRRKPDNARAHLNLGNCLSRLGNTEGAVAEYAKAVRYQPTYAQAHYNLANALAGIGRADEAIGHYRKAADLKPGDYAAHYNLANLLADRKQYDEAVRHYIEACRIKPDFADGHLNLAIALFFRGDYADAWHEVHIAQNQGGSPHPGLLQALSQKMPDPGR